MTKEGSLFSLMKNYKVETIKNEPKEKTKVQTNDDKKEGIIVAENQEQGSVATFVYWDYCKHAGGGFYLMGILLSCMLSAGSQVFTNLWLSWWTQSANNLDFSLLCSFM